ncbi:MAG: ABC transporter ATP-binding protein [Erysipelotrichaceae bacterium]|jgi:oligopeptide transport system ATP-binding protein|nr:ABC transporter ATP-binding protein [Erysipelotrichaceae bacterium]
MSILKVENLVTNFSTDQGTVQAVRGISFEVKQQEVLGIVGESGSGKSVTMFSVMGLLADNGRVDDGKIYFEEQDISPSHLDKAARKTYEKQMQKLRGNDIAMIFQDPMTFLNPVLKIGKQLMEPILIHDKCSKKEAKERALNLMNLVGIPSPQSRFNQYPHQFSGGMRQRIIIAIALACNPKLIIADEPTTALDVTIQAQVLELIQKIQADRGSSVIMITHDLGVVASMCDRILIMYGGKIVEEGTDREIFYKPKHPYTIGLLACVHNPDSTSKEALVPIPGSPPDLLNPPVGCPFVDRCEHAMLVCKQMMPDETRFSDTHLCRCWLNHKFAKEAKV